MNDATPLWIAGGVLLLVLQIQIIVAIFRTAKATEACAAPRLASDLRRTFGAAMVLFVFLPISAVLGPAACKKVSPGPSPALIRPTAPPRTITFTRGSGGSIRTNLIGQISLNQDSSLEREWITAHDASLAADLAGTVGISTAWTPPENQFGRGEYKYKAAVPVRVSEALSAIEVRFLLFDVWGDHIRTLTMTDVLDTPAGEQKLFNPTWNLYSENEASEFYASISYIARVRTQAGRVVETDAAPIIEEAKKFSRKFTAAQLEPKAPTK